MAFQPNFNPFGPARRTFPRPTARQRALAQWRGWDWSEKEKAVKDDTKSSGVVMPKVLAGLRMDCRLAETEIVKVWKHLMDANVAAHAQPTGIRNGTLFITVDSSVWLDEIVRYRRPEILERLRNSFGPTLIKRLSIRAG